MYMLLSIAGFLCLVVVFIVLGTCANAGQGVVIQVTDEHKLNMVLTNAIHTSRAMPGVELVVIVCGSAVTSFKRNSPAGSEIDNAKRHGIRIIVCEDSMQGMQLTKNDMYPGLDYVAYALTEIVTRQFSGWTYVRS